ncbi:winged helix-turn-helix domain-containing protein [Planosporangium sp. 12N6]|uniref:winged helix-turn-helix domain-containing protein n=1 Tax=Planosporangium spinosum TaxID=3402278 RepID=UPI003CEB5165
MPITPDYVRIADELEEAIRSGKRAPHSKLPSLSELQKMFNVGSTTIQLVMVRLEARLLIYRHQGKGIFVSEPNTWMLFPK